MTDAIDPAALGFNIAHIDEFAAYARNSNTHSDEQIGQIEAMIDLLGWTMPIAKHSAMGIAAGHGRLAAAKRIYAKGKRIKMPNGFALPDYHVPWIDVSAWTEEQVRAYVIMDNQIGRLSKFDDGMLASEIELLKDKIPLLLDLFDDLKPLNDEEGSAADDVALMPETGPVQDTFFITLSGPLEKQAKAELAIKQALGLWPDLQIERGTTRHG